MPDAPDPIEINNENDLIDFVKTLKDQGWLGELRIAKLGTAEVWYYLKFDKGVQSVQLQLGGDFPAPVTHIPAVLIERDGGGRYLQYTQADYVELQEVMNPGT